jgi:hypothetical protein
VRRPLRLARGLLRLNLARVLMLRVMRLCGSDGVIAWLHVAQTRLRFSDAMRTQDARAKRIKGSEGSESQIRMRGYRSSSLEEQGLSGKMVRARETSMKGKERK